jgi:hypothetical protein
MVAAGEVDHDYVREVIQSSGSVQLAIVDGMNVRDSRLSNYPRQYNAAPSHPNETTELLKKFLSA